MLQRNSSRNESIDPLVAVPMATSAKKERCDYHIACQSLACLLAMCDKLHSVDWFKPNIGGISAHTYDRSKETAPGVSEAEVEAVSLW